MKKQMIIDYQEYLDLIKLKEIIREIYFYGYTEDIKKEIENTNNIIGMWI